MKTSQPIVTPIDPEFNLAVLHMAHLAWPNGYDRTPIEPYKDYASMRADWLQRNRIAVYTRYSQRTIFGSSHVNIEFRAWHDSAHLLANADFSFDGELTTYDYQSRQLTQAFPSHPDLNLWHNLLQIEVVEQTREFLRTGLFLTDQRSFAIAKLQTRGLIDWRLTL